MTEEEEEEVVEEEEVEVVIVVTETQTPSVFKFSTTGKRLQWKDEPAMLFCQTTRTKLWKARPSGARKELVILSNVNFCRIMYVNICVLTTRPNHGQ